MTREEGPAFDHKRHSSSQWRASCARRPSRGTEANLLFRILSNAAKMRCRTSNWQRYQERYSPRRPLGVTFPKIDSGTGTELRSGRNWESQPASFVKVRFNTSTNFPLFVCTRRASDPLGYRWKFKPSCECENPPDHQGNFCFVYSKGSTVCQLQK